MDECNPALTPSEPRLQLTRGTDEKEVDATEYRKLIGSLRYLCNTRPDIAYSVGINHKTKAVLAWLATLIQTSVETRMIGSPLQ
ncbi:hypothetical protein A2U01_0054967, partial [Trifolium medium]|nr:hypothetical protein [Trifolium medium]